MDVGFQVSYAVEANQSAVDTYTANLGNHVVLGDLPGALKKLPRPGKLSPDVIIGGPPCQGFSVIGLMDPQDPRSQHIHAFMDAVRAFQPVAFCMENVKALATSARWKPVYHGLIARAVRLGYNVESAVLNAGDYTVPQARERMFLIGVRDGYPLFPARVTAARPLTVLEALQRLPTFGEVGNDSNCAARVVLAKKPVMRASPYKGSLLFNGSGRPLELDAVARTLPASMGGNGTPIVDCEELAVRLAQPDALITPWVFRHHTRLAAGKPNLKRPHPLRRITVEEAAALQSFPEGWVWKGSRNAQFRQIGNAVPPRLARYVALSVGHALQGRQALVEDLPPASLPPRRISTSPRSIAPRRRRARAA
jgi:DNA (cytosine-5)-methyltransferase 1